MERTFNSIDEVIEFRLPKIIGSKVFTKQNIPEKKLRNALQSYTGGINADDVLVLVDDTVWGGAKEGMILTKDTLYSKMIGQSPKNVDLKDIKEVNLVEKAFSVNYEEFIKMNMPDAGALKSLFKLIQDLVNHLSGGESSGSTKENQSTEDTSTESASILSVLTDIKRTYAKDGLLLAHQISPKQKNNIVKFYDVGHPREILGLIDTTILKSGKDGLVFTEKGICIHNAYEDNFRSLSYKVLMDAEYDLVDDRHLNILVNGHKFEFNPTTVSLALDQVATVLNMVKDYWYENCADIPEEEKELNKAMKSLPTPNGNYFRNIKSNLMKTHHMQSAGRHIGHFIDTLTTNSQEQENIVNRRNVFNENDDYRRYAKGANTFLQIALSIPSALSKNKTYHKKVLEIASNEYVSFEVLCFILYHMRKRVTEAFGDGAATSYIENLVMGPIFTPFVDYKTKASKLYKNPGQTTLEDIADPSRMAMKDPIMKAVFERVELYQLSGEKAMGDVSMLFCTFVYIAMVSSSDQFYLCEGDTSKVDEILKVFKADIDHDLWEFYTQTQKDIEQTLVNLNS